MDISKSKRNVPWDVFQQRPFGLKYAKGSGEVRPEVASVVGSLSRAGEAKGLAGIATTDEVGSFNGVPIDRGHVAEVRHVRPVFRKHASAVRLDLGLPRASHAGALQSKVDTSDPAEQ